MQATQSVYRFSAAGVNLKVIFTTPLLLDDLELVSPPAGYITFEVASADGKPHAVELYFDATAEWAVNQPKQQVVWRRADVAGLDAMQVGSKEQRTLATKGDNVRIDWGHFYVAVPRAPRSARSPRTRWLGRRLQRACPRRRRTTPKCHARPTTVGRC